MALPPPPTAPRPPASQQQAPAEPKRFAVQTGRQTGAQRVLLYGTGGVGKTELASFAPKPLFIDLEAGSRKFDVARIEVETFGDVRAILQGADVDPFETIVIDTATKLEDLALAHVIATVPHEKPGTRITGIESYGFSKGYRHLFDAFSLILQDCDRLIRRGKNVVMIAHVCTSTAPNPSGEDWLRYEPRLQHPKKENSIRDRVVGWADHVLFVGYDVVANREGKATGGGTRTIYTQELPFYVAKTRGAWKAGEEVPASMAYAKGDGAIWSLILGGAA